jgi:hypothetical protein
MGSDPRFLNDVIVVVGCRSGCSINRHRAKVPPSATVIRLTRWATDVSCAVVFSIAIINYRG